jgi:hypothetical protein
MPADPGGVPGPEHRPRPEGQLVSSPVPDRPMISAEAAAKTLCELFLTNADRGDNAANDHLIAEMVGRIRAQQESRDGDRGQQPPIPLAGPTPTSGDGRHD